MSGAHVESIQAIRDFLASLHTFRQEVGSALDSFNVEVQRTIENLLEGEPSFWQQQLRKTEDQVTAAKIELERCRVSKLPGGEPRSCSEERKQLDRARMKLAHVEHKIETVRSWGHAVRPKVDEYSARSTQLMSVLDTEFPRATATLNRVLDSLEAYVGLTSSGTRLYAGFCFSQFTSRSRSNPGTRSRNQRWQVSG